MRPLALLTLIALAACVDTSNLETEIDPVTSPRGGVVPIVEPVGAL